MTLIYRSSEDDQAREFRQRFLDVNVLLFDPRLEHSGGSIGNLFRALDASERAVDLIVIRGDSSIVANAAGDAVLAEVAANTPIYTLAVESKGNSGPVLVPLPHSSDPIDDGAFGAPDDVLSELRAGEVNAVLIHWSAVWHSDDTVHYELPSGKHADVFIRIAEALADPVDIARIADWLMPYLSDGVTVLADTGGMLALLLQLKMIAHQRLGWTIGIDTLARYPRGAVEVSEILPALTPKVSSGGKLLFLISVNSSGALLSMIRSFVAPSQLTVVALCDTETPGIGPSGIDSLTMVSVNRWDTGADGRCDECDDKKTFQIDARTYELVPYVGAAVPVDLNMPRAVKNQGLWEAAQRTGAVSLHHDSPHPPEVRHHPVYVDVPKLLLDEQYRARALEALTSTLASTKPDLVLLVEHGATPALASLLNDALAALPELDLPTIVTVSAAAAFDDATASAIGAASSMLLIDDGIVTGTTVLRLRERIYQAQKVNHRNAQVALFAVLFRPHNPAVVRDVRARFRINTGLEASWVDELYLPATGDRDCPWCRELGLLRLWSRSLGEHRHELSGRIEHLQRKPLAAPLLLGDGPEAVGLRTEESFWGTLDEVTAFAAVTASALDVVLEVDRPDPDFRQRYASVRLVFAAYYDAIIRAAALRTVKRRQLRHTSQDHEVPGWIAQIDQHSATPGLLSELAYAAAVTKLPAEPVLALLNRAPSSAHVELLRAIVERAVNPPPAQDPVDEDEPSDSDDEPGSGDDGPGD